MDSIEVPTDPWSEFALGIFALNGLIMRAGDEISGSVGQSSARWQVLGRAIEPKTVAQIARDVGYARQSVQRVADVLASEGLVTYTAHPADRRTKLLELTPTGLTVLTEIYERQLEWSQRVMALIDGEQMVSMATSLRNIAQIVEENLKNDMEDTQ